MTLGAVSIPVTLAVSLSRCIADAPVSVPIQLEMIAVVAASIGGALAARDRNLDLTGSGDSPWCARSAAVCCAT